jgi:predicted nuclease of predicted toxin-antitoxin system
MAKYLVDVNLPKFFSHFNSPDFEFVADLGLSLSDSSIWDYALAENLIILTKDTDFYYRCLTSKNPVKVIQFQFGNLTLKQLHQFFSKNWAIIENKIASSTLLIVEENEIRTVL